MRPPQLIALVLFFAGVVLHVFFLTIVSKRTGKSRFEKFLIALVSCLLVWYAGNFISLLLRQMDLSKVAPLVGWVDSVAFTGLGILPALLLHTHLVYFRERFPAKAPELGLMRVILIPIYASAALLVFALPRIFNDPFQNPLQKLGPFEFPFLVILSLAYLASAFLQLRIARNARNLVERKVFSKLFFLFLVIPVFTFWVFELGGARTAGFGDYLVYSALLASLVPSFLVTYYIYRFQFLHIQVHQSVATALIVLGVLAAYLVGIRNFVKYLETEFGAPEILLETTFLAVLLLFFPSLSDWLRSRISRIFASEIQHYRQIRESIGRSTSIILTLPALKEFIEEALKREFPQSRVRIILDAAQKPGADCYPLRSGDRRLGYLQLSFADPRPTVVHREGAQLLADEIGAAIERGRLLEKQFKLREELARKSHLENLGRMASTIAHNVKNPLSSMKTLIQLQSKAENLIDEQKKELQMMLEEIDRLAKIVNRLLKFSRLEVPTEDQSAEGMVSLRSIADSIIEVYRGELHARRIRIKTRVDSETLISTVRSDAARDILSNLLSNSIEASPEGGVVEIEMKRQGDQICFTVRDAGPGIPETLRDRVLEPFVTTKQSGTGLGLAIVHRRVEQLQGRIHIQSPIRGGKGTLITVIFPVDTAN